MANDQKRKWNTGGAIGDGSFFDGSAVNTILGVLVLVLTIGGAIALARFVSRHGDEIGEARFDTRNKDDKLP